jgi:uncharacterized protein
MKVLKMFVAMLAFVGVGALAQVPTVVDGEQKAAVKELLDAMNFKQVLSQMGNMMTQQMPQMMEKMLESAPGMSKMTPDEKVEARKMVQQASSDSLKSVNEIYNDPQIVQGFEDIMARAYAKHFSTAEIRATTAFYVSPAGKKALTIMPQMMQETMPEMMAMMAPRMNAMMEKVAKDVVAQVERKHKAKAAATAK